MQRNITIQEAQKILSEDDVVESILIKRKNKNDVVIMDFEEYKKINETKLIKRLKRAEQQIKDGEVTDAKVVFEKLREKYGY